MDENTKIRRIRRTLYNKESFSARAKEIHGPDKYNYDLVEYINCTTKVKIVCNDCGNVFEQIPSAHLAGNGCVTCKK